MRLSKVTRLAILDKMDELLSRPYGWTKGSWRKTTRSGREQFCLLGAAQEAYTQVTGKKSRGDGGAVAEALSIATLAQAKLAAQDIKSGGGSVAVFSFNDLRTTTKKDVLALVREKRAELAG